MKSVAVFCGASDGDGETYLQLAEAVGDIIFNTKHRLVYGGGGIGLMGAVANQVSQRGGEVVGVIPRRLFIKEVAHQGLTDLRVVENMHQRKDLMYQLADKFIILPGGMGTLDEFFEILTWKQLGLHQKPIYIFNDRDYYTPLLNWVEDAIKKKFIKQHDLQLFKVLKSLDQLENELIHEMV
jgi:uncharacterized protein (TIGR00730 family)